MEKLRTRLKAVVVTVRDCEDCTHEFRVRPDSEPLSVTLTLGMDVDATPKIDNTGEGCFESRLYPGLSFLKYINDVEYNGLCADLTPQHYHILELLNDVGGSASVDFVMMRCWKEGKRPTYGTFRSAISELATRLSNTSLPATVRLDSGMIVFEE